jgi:hypothetical protein
MNIEFNFYLLLFADTGKVRLALLMNGQVLNEKSGQGKTPPTSTIHEPLLETTMLYPFYLESTTRMPVQ